MTQAHPTNQQVSARLNDLADLLELQGANPFRVSAYRRAAASVAALERDLRELDAAEGIPGLMALPGVGSGIASAIHELIASGRMSRLERLRGSLDAAQLFQSIPGIGPELARRIHETLQIDSLEALEAAAHESRLSTVPGFGRRRIAALRATLESMLGRMRRARPSPGGAEPEVGILLDIDQEYREKAAAGRLRTIAPKRFNPKGEAWLPVLHTQRGQWHFTVLFSNTARAHELGRTRDWIVTYFYDGDHREGQHTIVTETQGPLAGRRVVRGREAACRAFYSGA
jgi:putative hydrolase